MIDIPAKTGKTVAVVLNPEEQKAVEKVAMKILKETGRYSKSEAVRVLIGAGAEKLIGKSE